MQKQKKFYLSPEGMEKLKKEYKELKIERIRKTQGIEAPQILHSEEPNPEYFVFQDVLSSAEARIADIENILKNAEVFRVPEKKNQNAVFIGAKVTVQVNGEHQDEIQIVGTLEANPSLGKISNESPVGKALLGAKVGQEVVLSSPIKTVYKIKKIKYENS